MKTFFTCAAAFALWIGIAQAQTVSAVLEPARTAEVRSTVAGRIADIAVAEGDRVAKGGLLARMDGDVQQARVALAEQAATATGQLQRAQAQLAQAQTLANRVERARANGAAQRWEVDAAQQAVRLAAADLVIAEEAQTRAAGQLAMERSVLAEFDLRAPFDGSVLELMKEPGEIIDTQEVIISFGHLETLEATAFFPVDNLATLEVGKTFAATVDNGVRETNTRVTVQAIDPRIDPASRTVRVTLTLPNAEQTHSAGATLLIDPS